MHLNTHAPRSQAAIARRHIAEAAEFRRNASPAEKAVERIVAQIKQRPDVRKAYLGCTTNIPGKPGQCLVHMWINGERRDIRVLPDGSMRWAAPVTFTEELWAETFGEVAPVDADEYRAMLARVQDALAETVHVEDLSKPRHTGTVLADLREVCGDDAETLAFARAELAERGECTLGGGAAPAFRLTLVAAG